MTTEIMPGWLMIRAGAAGSMAGGWRMVERLSSVPRRGGGIGSPGPGKGGAEGRLGVGQGRDHVKGGQQRPGPVGFGPVAADRRENGPDERHRVEGAPEHPCPRDPQAAALRRLAADG